MKPVKKQDDKIDSLVSGKKKTLKKAAVSSAEKSASHLRYTLKASMKHTRPKVWRRIELPGDISLGKLLTVLLDIMGFEESHPSAFKVGGREYEAYDLNNRKSRHMGLRLCDLVSEEKTKFYYNYDYGDNWEYELVAEKITPCDSKTARKAVCLAGKGNYFVDDIGGPYGYQNTIEILSNPESEYYDEWVEMYGTLEDFVEPFDIGELNRRLACRRC